MILDAIGALLMVLAALNVVSTTMLVAAAWRHRWPALAERATEAVVLAVIAVGFAVLGAHRLHLLTLPEDVSLSILAIGLVLVSVPSLVWLVAFLGGRFDESDAVTAARADDEAEEAKP